MRRNHKECHVQMEQSKDNIVSVNKYEVIILALSNFISLMASDLCWIFTSEHARTIHKWNAAQLIQSAWKRSLRKDLWFVIMYCGKEQQNPGYLISWVNPDMKQSKLTEARTYLESVKLKPLVIWMSSGKMSARLVKLFVCVALFCKT